MRQILEEIGHSPTLVVDEEESHIVWVEVDGKAQDIRLNGFRLTRTSCPCDQTVGPMSFFMEIEIDQIVLPTKTDRHGQTLVRGMALPTAQDLEVIEGLRLVHFKESHRVWNGALELLDMLQRSKATRDGFLVITFREVTITPLNTTIIPEIMLKSKFVTRWRELGMKKREPGGSLQVVTFSSTIHN